MAELSRTRFFVWRLAAIGIVCVLALVLLPKWLEEPQQFPAGPKLQGEYRAARLIYQDTPVAGVLSDVQALSGFRVLAFPDVGRRVFSGELSLAKGGQAAVEELAQRTSLELHQAGPHWVLVVPHGGWN